jgi:hypothetical protein
MIHRVSLETATTLPPTSTPGVGVSEAEVFRPRFLLKAWKASDCYSFIGFGGAWK